MEFLNIDNFSFAYPGQEQAALRGVSLTVERGEFLVLCGPSGCGKSTLLRQLKPAIAPHGERLGQILLDGQPLERLSQADSSRRIGFVQQNVDNQLVTDKVWHELAFGLESLGYETPVIRRRVAEMASFFGIEDWFYRDVASLSGGQKQILNLASVMVMQPDLLILDEPTSQLDPIAASEFLSVLGKINPYKETLKQAEDFTALLPEEKRTTTKRLSLEDAINCVHGLDHTLGQLNQERTELEAKKKDLMEKAQKIEPFQDLHCNLSSILDFHFIKFRFGKITKEYYNKFESYCYENSDTVFYRCHSDEQYVWGIYFCPRDQVTKVDAVFSSLHFERIYVPDEYSGTPEDAYAALQAEIKKTDDALSECSRKLAKCLSDSAEDLVAAKEQLEQLSGNFDVRRLAACTKSKKETFYILCGWMSEKDAASFQKDIENDTNLFCFIEDDANNVLRQPPTKLKNPKIFRPFEMYVKMYGLPNYNEIDPTIIVGLTYAFIFGIMFADVGQGLCLLIGGALLYHYKKMDLAAIMSTCAVFSVIFGFLFGSFFGFENVIPALWLHPKEAMTTLPFIGSMNTVFVAAVAFGMFMILTGMVLHMINAARNHKLGELLFSQNSLAGFIFYGALAVTLVLLFSGHKAPAVGVMVVMFGIPLLAIFLKEPLERMVEKKGNAFPETGKGMFFVQAFFELFDVLLSYFSNTISFVRVGAYAVSHAAMMEVVLMLGGATGGGSISWPVIVLGNVFVACLEALLVAIQVLRLEYYEMFSRFYEGDGKPFVPFLKKGEK